MTDNHVFLPGSSREPLVAARVLGPVAASTPIEVTLVLRRRAELPAEAATGGIDSADLSARFGADPADVDLVTRTVTEAGATVIQSHPASRRLRISGSVGTLQTMFGTSLQQAQVTNPDGRTVDVRHRTGDLSVPATLAGVVTAVLGLDDRPQARAQFRAAAAAAAGVTYTPLDLAKIYRMPAGTDGAGQTLAIIELGGGFAQGDLDTYFSGLGIATPTVTTVGVDSAVNAAGQDPRGADGEVLLDIEIAGAIAPKASIVVYFAPNTDAGFLDAVSTAAHATPTRTAMSHQLGPARRHLDRAGTDRHGPSFRRRHRDGRHRHSRRRRLR